jgi:ariadne-1
MCDIEGDEDFMSDMESDDEQSLNGNSGDDDQGIVIEHEPRDRKDDDWNYEVLSPDQIVGYMCEIIRDVSNVIQLPATTTRILLHHFKWDREKLMEIYYDGDQERLFKEAHIVAPATLLKQSSNSSAVCGGAGAGTGASSSRTARSSVAAVAMVGQSASSISSSSAVPGDELCQICFLSCPIKVMTGLECGHRFCKPCWTEYLTTKIMEEGMGQTIACAAHHCDILVDDATVMNLVTDKKVRSRYQHLITNSFVECNRNLAWCPHPHCANAIKVSCAEFKPVFCTCGCNFCFECGNDWHDPITCQHLKYWLKKCMDDSETSNWIAANTKECPKCNATIEKNGGCNHMICKNQSCKQEFCWICLGPWQSHGSSWYNCNRFEDAASKQARDAQEKSRAMLQRYLFYYNRYANHMQSMKFENKLYTQVKGKMEEMQHHNMSWIEVQFLKKAVDVLCQCRRTLMYTYSFAYYLEKNNQVMIFEDNQKDLETATEILSEYLERELTQENVTTIKQKVQDKYRYCENRRKLVLDQCREGYDRGWWKFINLDAL